MNVTQEKIEQGMEKEQMQETTKQKKRLNGLTLQNGMMRQKLPKKIWS